MTCVELTAPCSDFNTCLLSSFLLVLTFILSQYDFFQLDGILQDCLVWNTEKVIHISMNLVDQQPTGMIILARCISE